MTKKLYWQNPYEKEFNALIEKIRPSKTAGSVELLLDQTLFYPEGGGQPSDQGSINGCPVTYVYAEDALIWHIVTSSDNTFSPDEPVVGVLDWARRFDHMQQHLGQHILSAVFDDPFQARTIGFHLGEHHVTIDLDKGPFTQEKLEQAEQMANQIVFDNRPVQATLVDEEAYQALNLRKTPDITNEIRLVEIPEADLCACSGTHPRATGAVGMIKIIKSESYKGGCRLTFLCGNRALETLHHIQLQAFQTAASLSIGWPELTSAVNGLMDDNKQLAKENKEIHQMWSELERDRLLSEAPSVNGICVVMICDDSMPFQRLTFLANAFRFAASCVALLGVTSPSPRFILLNNTQLPDLSMQKLLKESIHHIHGKGGGNAASVQGGGNRPEGLEPMLGEIRTAILHHLKTNT